MNRILAIPLIVALTAAGLFGQRLYRFYDPGDWVTYTNTRYVTSIARGFFTVYFGTNGGILRYDINAEKWLTPLTVSDGLPDNRIRRLAVDRMTDEIWVETARGGSYFNPTWAEWRDNEAFPSERVRESNVRPSDLPMLFPSDNFSFMPGGTLVDRNLMEYPITQTLRDDNEVVWMGLWGLGAAKADLRRDDLKILRFGPYDADIAFLDRDGDDFWFLGGNVGLPGTITRFDRSVDRWEYFEPVREAGIVSDRFSAITHDDKSIWIGTDMGLVRLDKRSKSFRSYTQFDGIYGEQVNALLAIKNNLIIGTEQGVSVFDLAHDSIYAANSPNMRGRPVYAFAFRDRIIYAGTPYGVFTLELGSSQWRRLAPASPNLRGATYAMQIVDSLLYTAGEDGVVVINLNDNTDILYDRNTKFRNAELRTLLVHQGVIWVGGSGGLFRLSNRTGNWYRYTTNDGLVSQRISTLAGDGDHVWIGTDQGVTRFYWKVFNRSDWLE